MKGSYSLAALAFTLALLVVEQPEEYINKTKLQKTKNGLLFQGKIIAHLRGNARLLEASRPAMQSSSAMCEPSPVHLVEPAVVISPRPYCAAMSSFVSLEPVCPSRSQSSPYDIRASSGPYETTLATGRG